MEITFLGTSAGVPTPRRSLPAVAVKYKQHLLLFDCGEGTQRQMMKAGLGFCGKTRIFISHLHGDHFLGLLGLIQTMSLFNRKEKLEVYGSPGLKEVYQVISDTGAFHPTFPVLFINVKEGLVCREKNFKVYARLMNHSLPNYAYAMIENPRPGKFHPEKALKLGVPRGPLWRKLQLGEKVKLSDGRIVPSNAVVDPPLPGVKIVYSGDTRPLRRMIKFAKDADVLIHECTFDDSLNKTAAIDRHSTPTLIGEISRKANVKLLVLTHISARYSRRDILRKQAQRVFSNVQTAKDFARITL